MIRKVDQWVARINSKQLIACRMESFLDPRGRLCILVTERSDNPGPSVTNCHEKLRKEVVRWLGLPDDQEYIWFEQFDRDSYAPPRDDRSEVCRVYTKDGKPHWEYVPEEEWYAIYHAPRLPRVEVKVRKKVL